MIFPKRHQQWVSDQISSSQEYEKKKYSLKHRGLILLYLQRACRDFDGSLDPMTRIKQVKQTEWNDIRGWGKKETWSNHQTCMSAEKFVTANWRVSTDQQKSSLIQKWQLSEDKWTSLPIIWLFPSTRAECKASNFLLQTINEKNKLRKHHEGK